MPDQDSLSPESQGDIFVPSDEDRDPEAEARMQQGREDLDPNNALYDPYFEDAAAALSWRPEEV
jgi:hypothetical protein